MVWSGKTNYIWKEFPVMELIDRPTSLISGRTKVPWLKNEKKRTKYRLNQRPRPVSRIGCRDYFAWDIWCENYTPLCIIRVGDKWMKLDSGENSAIILSESDTRIWIYNGKRQSWFPNERSNFISWESKKDSFFFPSPFFFFSFFCVCFRHIFPWEIAHITPELITR